MGGWQAKVRKVVYCPGRGKVVNKSREKINSSLLKAKQAFIEYKKILNWAWAQAAHYLLDHKQLISGQILKKIIASLPVPTTPIISQWGVRPHDPHILTCYKGNRCTLCAALVHVSPTTVSSWVQWLCHIWKKGIVEGVGEGNGGCKLRMCM